MCHGYRGRDRPPDEEGNVRRAHRASATRLINQIDGAIESADVLGVGVEGGSRERGEGSEEVNYNISALLVLVVENCEQGWGEYAWKHCALVGE